MTVEYGNTPGTQVNVKGGAIRGVEIGEEEKVVIFANGDPSVGSESAESPVKVESLTEVENAFGTDTEIAELFSQVTANGANARNGYVYVVVPTQTAVSAESHGATSSFTLANVPIIEDKSLITVSDTVDGVDADIEFRYAGTPSTPSDSNTVYINPYTGEVEADASSDYEVDYEYLEWSNAFDSADAVVKEDESGVYVCNSPVHSVNDTLITKTENLRDPDYKMVKAVLAAEPNANTSESPPNPMYDIGSYSDTLDSLPAFVVVPAIQDDDVTTNVAAVAGRMAGNSLENPVRGETLSETTVESGKNDEALLTFSDRTDARGKQLMPLKGDDPPKLDGSLSSDTTETWETDIQTVRVVDRCVLLVKTVAEEFLNDLDLPDRDDLAAQTALGELEDLVDRGLLLDNTEDEENLFVRAASSSQGEMALEMGVTPVEAVETFTVDLTVG